MARCLSQASATPTCKARSADEVFKDFKNHVLHVRDGDWGGAPQAAREWYRRTVRALQAKDWQHAVYSAGVMSHYVVDPIQPFHTHQTEAEGTIHRAVEWSLSKAFPEMLLILEQELGFPLTSPCPRVRTGWNGWRATALLCRTSTTRR